MKQVKELSVIQSVSTDNSSVNELSSCHCAAGFASVDFIIWSLITDTTTKRAIYDGNSPSSSKFSNLFTASSWIATGCEDRTERLTRYRRYMPGVENWSASKLLGEHVGGSAMRSICCVSKISIVPSDVTNIPDTMENIETPLSSVW
ncbi:unnamed protein product [Prunus armeniaca]|uniref:Uncharacterized protein n=1 Tax=Prunus armeniaca TaxID=36596 RepID=A0A6J5UPE6_PRUAR|nr:unnamed protein product [Prunus armeniaca]